MNQIQTPETIPVPGKQLMQLDQWDRGVIIGLILVGSGQIIRYKTQQGTFLYSFYVTKTLNGFEPRKNLIQYVFSTFYPLRWRSAGWNIHDIQPGLPNRRGEYPKTEYALELKPTNLFKFFAEEFFDYDSGQTNIKRRIVPKLVNRWLTPLSLCIMFLDSGGCSRGNTPYLNLSHYPRLDDRLNIEQALKYNYNIDVIEVKHGSKDIRFHIQENDVQKFFEIIEPFATPLDCRESIQRAKRNWQWSVNSKD